MKVTRDGICGGMRYDPIKRETYFNREHAERIVNEILDLVKEYIMDILNEMKEYFKGGK